MFTFLPLNQLLTGRLEMAHDKEGNIEIYMYCYVHTKYEQKYLSYLYIIGKYSSKMSHPGLMCTVNMCQAETPILSIHWTL